MTAQMVMHTYHTGSCVGGSGGASILAGQSQRAGCIGSAIRYLADRMAGDEHHEERATTERSSRATVRCSRRRRSYC